MGIDRWSQALSWHDTLREADEKELTHAVGREWQDWYADAENRRIFDAVSRLLADRALYRERRRPSKAKLAEDSYDLSVPVAEWRRAHAPRESRKCRPSAASRWLWLSGGIGAAAIVALFVFWVRPLRLGGGPASPAVYQTGVGGLKDVRLPDGSSIILGARTRLSVALSSERRSVHLIEGQAWFKVVHDPHRPFVVAAGNGTITDVGTAFLVTRESDRVVVTVTEGVVDVTTRPSMRRSVGIQHGVVARPVLAPIRVIRGEELAFDDNGAFGAVKRTDTHAATAWTHGRLIFDDQPLRYVVDTVNRYSSRRIVVGASAGALRFSGIVFDDEIDDWLRSLQTIFPVTVQERPSAVSIRMRSANPVSRAPSRERWH